MTGRPINGKDLISGLPSLTKLYRKKLIFEGMVFACVRLEDIPDDVLSSLEFKPQGGNPRARKERLLSLVGKALAVQTICQFVRCSPEDLLFSVSETGKPYLVSGDAHFNISHSGDMVVCAVADTQVGADVELIRRPFPENVARRVFTEDELEAVGLADDRDAYLTYLWTLHEAYVKMTGEGVSGLPKLDLSGVRVYIPEVDDGYKATVILKHNK